MKIRRRPTRALRFQLVAWSVGLGALLLTMIALSTGAIVAQRLRAERDAHEANALTLIAGQLDAALNDLDSRLWLINTSDAAVELMSTPVPPARGAAIASAAASVRQEVVGSLMESALVDRVVLIGRNDYLAVVEGDGLTDLSQGFHYQDFASDSALSPYFSGRQGARYVSLGEGVAVARGSGASVRRLVDGRCILSHPVFSEENIILGAVAVVLKAGFLSEVAGPYADGRALEARAGDGEPIWRVGGEGIGNWAGGAPTAAVSLKATGLSLASRADGAALGGQIRSIARRMAAAAAGALVVILALSRLLARLIYLPLHQLAQSMSTGEPLLSPIARRYAQLLNRLSLRGALTGYFALTVVLPTLAFGLGAARLGYDAYQGALTGHALSLTRQLVGGVERRLAELDDLKSYLSADAALYDLPGGDAQPLTDAQRRGMDDLARRAKMMNNQLMSINLYSLSGRNIYSSLYLEHQPAAMFDGDFLRTLRRGSGELVYMGLAEELYPNPPIRVGWPMIAPGGSGEPWGYMVVWLNQAVLADAVDDLRLEKTGHFFVLDANGEALDRADAARTRALLAQDAMAALTRGDGGRASVRAGGQDYEAFASAAGAAGMRVVGAVPRDELQARVLPAVQVVLALCALYTLLSLLVARQVARRIAEPLNHLRRLLADAGDGQWDRMEYGGRNEIATLVDQYNRMVMRMDQLITESYRARLHESRLLLAEREAQLKALQQQINPHFLYNTLDAIKWMAHRRGAIEAYDMTIALGNFFRGVISNQSDVITVAEELEHLKNYLYIQRIRFSGRFEVVWRIDEAALPRRTLKLILQPLVENAIMHGMEQVEEGGVITISAAMSGDFLIYAVADNGAGIESEALAALRSRLMSDAAPDAAPDGAASIGLVNVARRLQLHFGASSRLDVDSEPAGGTRVTVRIPMVL